MEGLSILRKGLNGGIGQSDDGMEFRTGGAIPWLSGFPAFKWCFRSQAMKAAELPMALASHYTPDHRSRGAGQVEEGQTFYDVGKCRIKLEAHFFSKAAVSEGRPDELSRWERK